MEDIQPLNPVQLFSAIVLYEDEFRAAWDKKPEDEKKALIHKYREANDDAFYDLIDGFFGNPDRSQEDLQQADIISAQSNFNCMEDADRELWCKMWSEDFAWFE